MSCRLLLLFTLSTSTFLGSTLAGPTYPPPGGVTFSSVGSAGGGIGKTNFYTNFDSTQYVDLYFGPTTIGDVYSDGHAIPGNMTFFSYDPSTEIATWQSNTVWTFTDTQNGQTFSNFTVLKFQAQSYTGTAQGFQATGLALTTKGAVGATGPASEPLLHVTGDFQIQYEFETTGGSPVLDYYNALSGGPSQTVRTGISNGFDYSSPTVAPEPATLALFAVPAAALLFFRRRFHA